MTAYDGFQGWRTAYFLSTPGSDERNDSLEGMRINAQCREDWSELFWIATSGEDRLPLSDPFVQICTDGILLTPLRADVMNPPVKLSLIQRLRRYLDRIARDELQRAWDTQC